VSEPIPPGLDPAAELRILDAWHTRTTERFTRANDWAEAMNRDHRRMRRHFGDNGPGDEAAELLDQLWRVLDDEYHQIEAEYALVDAGFEVLATLAGADPDSPDF
jgi:hypothetical protein